MDGTEGEQQLRDICGLPDPIEPEAPRAAECDLGQCPGAPFDKLRRGEAVREYLRASGLGLRLVSPKPPKR